MPALVRRRMTWWLPGFAMLVGLVLLAASEASATYRDRVPAGAWLPKPPTEFGGVRLPAADAGAARKLADRLAIATRSCREPGGWWLEGVQLGPTVLIMQSYGFEPSVLGLPTTGACPLLVRMQDWGCPWYAPMGADQPAGARHVLRVTALVDDLDSLCASARWEVRGTSFPIGFGRAFDLPDLGARARDVTMLGGTLRFIMPTAPDGLAARWLADGGPRWVGFALAVEDLDIATRALERRSVPVLRLGKGAHATVVVEPHGTGGTLMELVEQPIP